MGLRRNKRGIGVTWLVLMLIPIISLIIVFFPVIHLLGAEAPSKQADAACAASVAVRARAVIHGLGAEVHLAPFLCQTQEVEINAKAKTREEVIAGVMKYTMNVWKIWGAGKHTGLTNRFLIIGNDACFRYYNIKIKNLEYDISAQTILEYMRTHDYVENISYYDFVTKSSGTSNIWICDGIKKSPSIYSIIFMDSFAKKTGLTAAAYRHYNTLILASLEQGKIKTSKWRMLGITLKDTYCTWLGG